ncbi:hypothetical protein LX36DRAFT_672592 [Colletotrichum falcatum]|nr:hypothetical protein LX36DRAFT_672592 [Colletotrichum falcatum]
MSGFETEHKQHNCAPSYLCLVALVTNLTEGSLLIASAKASHQLEPTVTISAKRCLSMRCNLFAICIYISSSRNLPRKLSSGNQEGTSQAQLNVSGHVRYLPVPTHFVSLSPSPLFITTILVVIKQHPITIVSNSRDTFWNTRIATSVPVARPKSLRTS